MGSKDFFDHETLNLNISITTVLLSIFWQQIDFDAKVQLCTFGQINEEQSQRINSILKT